MTWSIYSDTLSGWVCLCCCYVLWYPQYDTDILLFYRCSSILTSCEIVIHHISIYSDVLPGWVFLRCCYVLRYPRYVTGILLRYRWLYILTPYVIIIHDMIYTFWHPIGVGVSALLLCTLIPSLCYWHPITVPLFMYSDTLCYFNPWHDLYILTSYRVGCVCVVAVYFLAPFNILMGYPSTLLHWRPLHILTLHMLT